MRLENTIKNARYNFIFFLAAMLFNFVSRTFFIKYLGSDLLGLNGILLNLISFLNLAELGVSYAITYSLYKPLASGDNEKIERIMYLFKYYYKRIAGMTLIGGLFVSLSLPLFIKGQVDIVSAYMFFFLYLFNAVITYFLSYKQTLIIADQKQYIITVYTNIFKILKTVIQIFCIIQFKSYLSWIVLEVIFNLLALTFINKKCDKIFTNVNFNPDYDIEEIKKENKNIIGNVKDAFFHKIGGFIVYQTDGLLISFFLKLKDTAIYGNYFMLTSSILGLLGTVMGSLTASIGNLVAEDNIDKSIGIFKKLYVLDQFIAIIISFTLYHTINPFVAIWIGKDLLFEMSVVFVLMINIYIQISRGAVDRFKDSYGLFWDRYAPAVEGTINLVISIILIKKIGIVGLFIGTLCSHIAIILIWKPYILFKYGFKKPLTEYVLMFVKTIVSALIIIFISTIVKDMLIGLLPLDITTFIGFIGHAIITFISVIVIALGVYMMQKDFRGLVEYIKSFVKRKIAK